MGSSYKTAAADLVTVTNRSTSAMFVVLHTTTAGGHLAGDATFHVVDGTPDAADSSATVASVVPTLATDGATALSGADALWIQVGGPATGPPVGSGSPISAPSTILVYSDTLDNASANAKLTVCQGATCTAPPTTRFLTVDDAQDNTGKFSGGAFGGTSTCSANRGERDRLDLAAGRQEQRRGLLGHGERHVPRRARGVRTSTTTPRSRTTPASTRRTTSWSSRETDSMARRNPLGSALCRTA